MTGTERSKQRPKDSLATYPCRAMNAQITKSRGAGANTGVTQTASTKLATRRVEASEVCRPGGIFFLKVDFSSGFCPHLARRAMEEVKSGICVWN